MIVQLKAATRTAMIGRLAILGQVAFKIDHSGLMEKTKAASAICDVVSKARIFDSANTMELLRNSIRSAAAASGRCFSSSTAAVETGGLGTVRAIAPDLCRRRQRHANVK